MPNLPTLWKRYARYGIEVLSKAKVVTYTDIQLIISFPEWILGKLFLLILFEFKILYAAGLWYGWKTCLSDRRVQ